MNRNDSKKDKKTRIEKVGDMKDVRIKKVENRKTVEKLLKLNNKLKLEKKTVWEQVLKYKKRVKNKIVNRKDTKLNKKRGEC